MTAMGVASPSAHGQAIISTATALTSAWAKRGGGPHTAPRGKGKDGDEKHRRDEVAGRAIGEALNRRTRSLRIADHAHDLREHGFGADALGAHHERTVDDDGGADHTVASAFVDRRRLAADHRLVHDGRPVGQNAVDRNFFARPNAQPIAADDVGQRNVHFAPVRERVAPFWGRGRAADE